MCNPLSAKTLFETLNRYAKETITDRKGLLLFSYCSNYNVKTKLSFPLKGTAAVA